MFFIAHLFNHFKKDILLLLPDADEASDALDDLTSILGAKYSLLFPSSYKRTLQYEQLDKSNMLLRTEALEQLSKHEFPHILVTYPEAVVEQVISQKEFQQKVHVLHKGEQVDTQFINDILYEFGFERVDFVTVPGQFSVRGSIIDIYSFSNDLPYRLDFFGDEIESIRTFNVDDQLSVETVDEINIIPDIQGMRKTVAYTPIFSYLQSPIVFCKSITETVSRLEKLATQTEKIFKADEEKAKNLAQILPIDSFTEFAEKSKLCEIFSTSSYPEATTPENQPQISTFWRAIGSKSRRWIYKLFHKSRTATI